MDASTLVLLLAASWLNVSLYTLELVLCRRYFKRPNRPFLYKAGVLLLILFDTTCTVTICVNMCFVVLDPVAPLTPTSITIFMTYCSAAVEQAILCHLFFTLTRNILVTAFLAIFVLAHMGLAFTTGALILVLDSEFTAALNTTTASSVTCAATDIFIAIALGSRVWKSLSPTDIIPARNSFARRFLLLCVSAGLIVASNTLIMLGLLLKGNAAFSFFFSCQGRVYSLTLLTNFLVGIYFRRDATTEATTMTHGPPRQHTSAITGVVFDVIDGYDTESMSANAARVGPAETKARPTSASQPMPYNYNLDAEWVQLEHRPSPNVRSAP
ncbi:hypothetical protein MVEN_00920200 [Mycena venus]|uniref:Transmembrane protein n=1 Tax=Mycena venus TaxID=2733690 RepID=A0A8H6YCG2_9AGAR|nr:hypothetical protein MVEN_00920200 [Mycena venus]